MNPPHDHAVVIGGGIAGLLAARTASQVFSRATIVERDRYAEEPGPRNGVPQSHHVHVLLRRGWLELQNLFPTLDEELERAGAPRVDWTADLTFITPTGQSSLFSSGFETRTASRSLLEYLIRRQIAALPIVSLLPETEVTGWLADPASRVTGVSLRSRVPGGDPAQNPSIDADLVVDASGRSSRSLDWLASLGFAPPPEESINSFLGYASRIYRRPSNFQKPAFSGRYQEGK